MSINNNDENQKDDRNHVNREGLFGFANKGATADDDTSTSSANDLGAEIRTFISTVSDKYGIGRVIPNVMAELSRRTREDCNCPACTAAREAKADGTAPEVESAIPEVIGDLLSRVFGLGENDDDDDDSELTEEQRQKVKKMIKKGFRKMAKSDGFRRYINRLVNEKVRTIVEDELDDVITELEELRDEIEEIKLAASFSSCGCDDGEDCEGDCRVCGNDGCCDDNLGGLEGYHTYDEGDETVRQIIENIDEDTIFFIIQNGENGITLTGDAWLSPYNMANFIKGIKEAAYLPKGIYSVQFNPTEEECYLGTPDQTPCSLHTRDKSSGRKRTKHEGNNKRHPRASAGFDPGDFE